MKGLRDAHASLQPSSRLASWYIPGRADGFGDRLLMFDNTNTGSLELLRFRDPLTAAPGFEEALRERVRAVQGLRHPAFPPVRAVQHLDDAEGLALVSVHVEGQRLSELFEGSARKRLHPGVVTWVLRELIPALAALQGHGPALAHGALSHDRLVLKADGHLAITEHVLGAALERLQLDPETLARDFGLVVPGHSPTAACITPQTDVIQMAGIAVALLLGRPFTRADLERVPELLDEVSELGARASHPVEPLRRWLERALLGDASSYRTARDAQLDLKELPHHAGAKSALPPAPRLVAAAGAGHAAAAADLTPGARATLRPVPRPQETGNSMRPYQNVSDFADSFPSESDPGARSEEGGHEQAAAAADVTAAQPISIEPAAPTLVARRVDEAPVSDQWRLAEVAALQTLAHRAAEAPRLSPEPRAAAGTPAAGASRARLRGLAVPTTVSRGIALALAAVVIGEAAIIAVLARRPSAPAAAAVVIESPRPGDTVEVNGKTVGTTPYSLAATAGTRVRVLSAAPSFEGAAAKAVVPPRAEPAPATPAPVAIPDAPASRRGGLRLVSSIDLTVLQGDRVLGSTSEGPIFLPAGTQQVQLVNTALGYKATQSLTVKAGQIGTQRIDVPNGKLNLNAQPGWARVSIDGNPVGDTPLANVAVPIGEHEIVFRHPQLGEKRERVVVRAEGTQRVTASFP